MPKKAKGGGGKKADDGLGDVIKKIGKFATNKKFVDRGGLRDIFRELDGDGSVSASELSEAVNRHACVNGLRVQGELDHEEFAKALHKMVSLPAGK